jgi:hypothetical protein
MTDVEWARVGRMLDAMADELTDLGWHVVTTWDRPHNRVTVDVRPVARCVVCDAVAVTSLHPEHGETVSLCREHLSEATGP